MTAGVPGDASRPWFYRGLCFSCQRCGRCCTGEPGFTWLSESEAGALAARLELDAAVFRARFTRTVWRDGVARFSLIEKAGDCVFWRAGEGCAVYDQRPRQCRTWPFWRRVVASPGDWAKAAADCPGMNRGEFHDAAAIATITADDGLGGGG